MDADGPVYDASIVNVVQCGDKLSDEWSCDCVRQSAIFLRLYVRQQFASLRILHHQTIQRRRLHTQLLFTHIHSTARRTQTLIIAEKNFLH